MDWVVLAKSFQTGSTGVGKLNFTYSPPVRRGASRRMIEEGTALDFMV